MVLLQASSETPEFLSIVLKELAQLNFRIGTRRLSQCLLDSVVHLADLADVEADIKKVVDSCESDFSCSLIMYKQKTALLALKQHASRQGFVRSVQISQCEYMVRWHLRRVLLQWLLCALDGSMSTESAK